MAPMIPIHDPGLLLFLLIVGHALADFPLQPSFLAESKNRYSRLGTIPWPYALSAHALIHGGFVAVLTGSAVLGVAETVSHWITDWTKCEDRIGLAADQVIHIACKGVWVLAVLQFAR